jgi:predicted ATP-grasp superfamily ATP-dependent carboligase
MEKDNISGRSLDGPPAVVVGIPVGGLGTVRSLARAGIEVIGVDSDLRQASARTKYCRKIRCPDIGREEELLDTLVRLGKESDRKPVLFLSSDTSVLIVSRNREVLRDYYSFNMPSKSVVEMLMDKTLFSEFASENGHLIPRTFIVRKKGDIDRVVEEASFPLIVKPYVKGPSWDGKTQEKAFKVLGASDLTVVMEDYGSLCEKFVVQEWIPGGDSEVYFCLLWYNGLGDNAAALTGRKIVQWPIETGSTCVAEVAGNDTVLRESVRLFDSIGYRGIGSVEFKRDVRDDTFKIIEPTVGRSDLQSAIAFHSGLNIPLLEYCDCSGMKGPSCNRDLQEVCWINEENLFWFLRKKTDRSLIGKVRQIAGRKRAYALFDPGDIGPFVNLVSLLAKNAAKKLGKSVVGTV